MRMLSKHIILIFNPHAFTKKSNADEIENFFVRIQNVSIRVVSFSSAALFLSTLFYLSKVGSTYATIMIIPLA